MLAMSRAARRVLRAEPRDLRGVLPAVSFTARAGARTSEWGAAKAARTARARSALAALEVQEEEHSLAGFEHVRSVQDLAVWASGEDMPVHARTDGEGGTAGTIEMPDYKPMTTNLRTLPCSLRGG